MDIKTYWDVLYKENSITEGNKISQNSRIAPRHIQKNIYKGYPCMFLYIQKGSITVEASFCVPVFFLALFSLFYIFQCIYRINYIEDSLADCAREYAVFGTKTGMVTTLFNEKVVIKYDEDAEVPICYASYSIKIPFLGSRFFKINLYQQNVISSYSGKSMKGDNSKKGEDFVYITKSGKVYHCDAGCTYLKPSIKKVQGIAASSKRNSSGGKYKPCEKCCKDTIAENLSFVFITNYGDRYHTARTCPGLKRDVRRVKELETGNLAGCSKCVKEP